jgi:ABC-2 type transport system ATP-binding protein
MLEIKAIRHTYPNGVRALNGISLSIPKGMYGLLGPNGAGKSSLMRTIATLQVPDKGSIMFDGLDALKEPEKMRANLGYLPQDFGVYPRVTAYQMLRHIAVLKGSTDRTELKDTVESLLNQVNLWGVRDKAIAGFSGGMRQRFGIAQALVGNPQLIIVDEPTAGLDPEERNRFLNLLAGIGDRAVVILSTHIVEDVYDLCPEAAIMAGGTLLASGPPSELTKAFEGKHWQATIPREELGAYEARCNVISLRLIAGKTQIHVQADKKPGPEFSSVKSTLEDVYLSHLAIQRKAA